MAAILLEEILSRPAWLKPHHGWIKPDEARKIALGLASFQYASAVVAEAIRSGNSPTLDLNPAGEVVKQLRARVSEHAAGQLIMETRWRTLERQRIRDQAKRDQADADRERRSRREQDPELNRRRAEAFASVPAELVEQVTPAIMERAQRHDWAHMRRRHPGALLEDAAFQWSVLDELGLAPDDPEPSRDASSAPAPAF